MPWNSREVDLLLDRFAPSGTALLVWLCARVDDTVLAEIALADYGICFDEYLAALQSIRDTSGIRYGLE